MSQFFLASIIFCLFFLCWYFEVPTLQWYFDTAVWSSQSCLIFLACLSPSFLVLLPVDKKLSNAATLSMIWVSGHTYQGKSSIYVVGRRQWLQTNKKSLLPSLFMTFSLICIWFSKVELKKKKKAFNEKVPVSMVVFLFFFPVILLGEKSAHEKLCAAAALIPAQLHTWGPQLCRGLGLSGRA